MRLRDEPTFGLARLPVWPDRRPTSVRRTGPSALRRFAIASVAVHLVVGAVVLLAVAPARPPDEVPATIQVLFGDNAETEGAKAAAAQARSVPAPPAPVTTAVREAEPAEGDVTMAAKAAPAAAAAMGAAAPAPSPVRLGDGDIGLKLNAPPDAGMIEAQADPGNRAPKYPALASEQHQQGRVVIRMYVDTQGRVSRAEVLESSGHPALDRAAREALARWQFIPALRDGLAVPSFRDQAANFVLDGEP